MEHTRMNPVAWINEGSNSKSIYDRSIGNFELKYDIVAGLSATGRVGIYNFDDFGKVDVKEQNIIDLGLPLSKDLKDQAAFQIIIQGL